MDELTCDAITGGFRIMQRRRGHRYSLDDVLTAYEASCELDRREAPRQARMLDLGCGIGSVLLMVAFRHQDARLVGLEAQAESLDLAHRNVELNGLTDRVALIHGDLRDPLVPMPDAPFDLITGTPPYFPSGTVSVSPDPQRAHARVELRGGVEDYLAAGARHSGPDTRIVLCADARRPDRVLSGAAAAGLVALSRRDAIPRAGHARKGALFTVWLLAPASGRQPDLVERAAFVARAEDGSRTEAYKEVRRYFGL